MNRGHESLDNAILLVNDLGHGGEAVGGARGVRDNIGTSVVLCVVHTDHVHWGIGRRCRDDNFLGASSKMGLNKLSSTMRQDMRTREDKSCDVKAFQDTTTRTGDANVPSRLPKEKLN